MEVSIFLGKFWGLYMIIFGCIFLFKPTELKSFLSYMKDEKFVFLIGVIILMIGLFTVLLHNVWTNDWRMIVTICGWIAIIKGFVRIGFPKEITQLLLPLKFMGANWLLLLVLLLGGFLFYSALMQQSL